MLLSIKTFISHSKKFQMKNTIKFTAFFVAMIATCLPAEAAPTFDGFYLKYPGENPVIPWTMMILLLIGYTIFMALITGMSRVNSGIEDLLQSTQITRSLHTTLKMVVIPFSMIMALQRAIDISPLNLAMILVGTGVLLFVAFNLFNKFKQSQIPTLYFLGILAIQSLPTAHYKTPVFIVPVLVGLVIGYCLGSIDSKVKDKIEELAD